MRLQKSKKHIITPRIFTILLVLLCGTIIAQSNEEFKIHVKDYHKAAITDIEMHPSGAYFLSADESGKIIQTSTSDYDYLKTIAPGNSIPVREIRMYNNGDALLVTSGFDFYTSKDQNIDSLTVYNLKGNRELQSKPLSLTLLGGVNEEVVLIASKDPSRPGIFGYESESFAQLFSIDTKYKVQEAELSKDRSLLFVTTSNFTETFITIYNVKTQQKVYEETLPKNLALSKIFTVNNEFGAILFDKEKNNVVVTKYTKDFSKATLNTFQFEGSIRINTEIVVNKDIFYLIVQPNNTFSNHQVIIITNKDGKLKSRLERVEKSSQTGIVLPSKNQSVFFETSSSNEAGFTNYNIYENDNLKLIEQFPKISFARYNAYFLPYGDLLFASEGDYSQDDFKSQIKYFEPGTFNNRFAKLRYDDYFKTYNKQEISVNGYHSEMMDTGTGEGIFTSWKSDENNHYSYLVYNFLQDDFEHFFTSTQKIFYKHIEDYNSKVGIILAGFNDYYDQGHATPNPYRIITRNEEREIEGKFKHGVISHDGKYILTVNTDDVLQIRRVNDLKIIYSEQIENPIEYRLFPDPESDFFVSVKNQIIEIGKCNTYSLSLIIKDDVVTKNRSECGFVEDLSIINDEIAFIFDGVGVRFRENGIPYNFSDKPLTVSLNKDATRLLVSYEKGSIKLYDTKDLSLLATVYNPDKKSHLFYTPEGKYMTNTEADALLKATRNGASIPFNQVPKSYYDPVAVLSSFGSLDKKYKEALEKSLTVREENVSEQTLSPQSMVEILVNGSNTKTIVNDGEFMLSLKVNDKNNIKPQITVVRNGVKINDLNFNKAGTGIYETNITVVDSINILDVSIKDTQGKITNTLSKRVLYDGPELERNLYIVAVGVSDYNQDAYDLTFADKDALDFVAVYDVLQERDQEAYLTNFYGNRYSLVNGNDGKKEIKHYDSNPYSSSSELMKVDQAGMYWLEHSETDTKLWNFKTQVQKEISLGTKFKDESFEEDTNSLIFPSSNGNGFYYSTGKETVVYYNFLLDSEQKSKLPFEIVRNHNEGFTSLLENNSWSLLQLQDNEEDYGVQYLLQTLYTNVDNAWSTSDYKIKLDFQVAEILATSSDGKYILLQNYNKELWVVSRSSSNTNISKLDGEFERAYGTKWFINNEHISSIGDYTNKEYDRTKKINKYDHTGAVLPSKQLTNTAASIRGYGYNGERIVYVAENSPVANANISFNSKEEKEYQKPISFKKVYSTYLTNEQATDESIKDVLQKFLNRADERDEIIVFLAGHGVLDKDLAYYYAPYNMDFENVSASGVAFEEITNAMSQSKASKKLLLMDTCHSGNTLDLEQYEITTSPSIQGERGAKVIASKKGTGKTPKVSEIVTTLFDNFLSQNGATIISASSGQDVAYENKELSNGALTTAFIEQIKNQRSSYPFTSKILKPVLLTDAIITEVQKAVLESTNNKQVIDVKEINKQAPIKIW